MWIGRRLDNSIYGAWTMRQADDVHHPRQEEISDNDSELLAFLAPRPGIDFSDVDNVEKALKSLALVTANWSGKTNAQLKTEFKAAWDSLP